MGVLYHGLQGRWRLGGILPAENDDEVVTLGQLNVQPVTSSTSNLFMQNTEFPEDLTATVPTGYNAIAFGTYTVNGDLTVDGEFRVVDWPE